MQLLTKSMELNVNTQFIDTPIVADIYNLDLPYCRAYRRMRLYTK